MTLNEALKKLSPAREAFLRELAQKYGVNLNVEIEGISGTRHGLNYGDIGEAFTKLVFGQVAKKIQGAQADIVLNGEPMDIKTIDREASASKGHNNDTQRTIILANIANYQGFYVVDNNKIVWTKSNKMQRAQTLALAKPF